MILLLVIIAVSVFMLFSFPLIIAYRAEFITRLAGQCRG